MGDDVECPVCGMAFPEDQAEAWGAETVMHEGATYYFDSPVCRESFEEDPDAHL